MTVYPDVPTNLTLVEYWLRSVPVSSPAPCHGGEGHNGRIRDKHTQAVRIREGRIVRFWRGNCGPNGYHEWAHEDLGPLPHGVDVVTVPGAILVPWDGDFALTYIGPDQIVRAVKEAIMEYHRLMDRVREAVWGQA